MESPKPAQEAKPSVQRGRSPKRQEQAAFLKIRGLSTIYGVMVYAYIDSVYIYMDSIYVYIVCIHIVYIVYI